LSDAFAVSAGSTSSAAAFACTCSYSAAAPVTCGVAIDVPLIVFVASSLVSQSDVMLTPGAKMSRHGPRFEKLASTSLISVAPTVIADGSLEGDSGPGKVVDPMHGFPYSLPAATA